MTQTVADTGLTTRQYNRYVDAVLWRTPMWHVLPTPRSTCITFYCPLDKVYYAIYPNTGYVRRRNGLRGVWYQLNPRSTHPIHCRRPSGWNVARGTILYPHDPASLINLVVSRYRTARPTSSPNNAPRRLARSVDQYFVGIRPGLADLRIASALSRSPRRTRRAPREVANPSSVNRFLRKTQSI